MTPYRKLMIACPVLCVLLFHQCPRWGFAAPGDSQVRLVQTGEVTIGDPVNAFNTIAFDQHKLITHGEYQYTLFWDAERHLRFARRHLATDDVQQVVFPDRISNPTNSHLNAVVGISPKDGRLHLSYDHHNSPFRYRVSQADFVTTPPETLSTDQFSDKINFLSEPTVTYPAFFNDGSGNLYLMFRTGSAGNGDWIMYRHDAVENAWARVGMVISRAGTYKGSSSRCAYHNDLLFDRDDRLHLAWVFREPGPHRTNHGLYYAYSDDYGATWHNDGGEQIADLAANQPIRVDSAGIRVLDIPQNSWVLNQDAMVLDFRNQPHMIISRSCNVTANIAETNIHIMHYWRTPDGQWHEQTILDTKSTIGRGEGWTQVIDWRGDVFMDEHDNLYAYFPMQDDILYAAQAKHSDGWRQWTVYPLTDAETTLPHYLINQAGQKYDRFRWARDAMLSVPLVIRRDGRNQYVIRDYVLGRPAGRAAEAVEASVSRPVSDGRAATLQALPEPPAGALGYPDRSANLDALPGFRKPPNGYGPVPIYLWTGDQLTRERLAWQLDVRGGRNGENHHRQHPGPGSTPRCEWPDTKPDRPGQ